MLQRFKRLIQGGTYDASEIKKSFKNCLSHDIMTMPNINANETCKTCNFDICYICSNKHFESNHEIRWTKAIRSLDDKLYSPTDPKNIKFNEGYLSKLSRDQLICVCGKKINQSPEGGMCVACGSATCSQQCHDKQILNKNKCLFHINFSVDMEGFSMRSLLFQNVDFLHQNQMAKGTPVVQTSRNFVYGMLSDDPNIVYLQRGYRIYGNPVPQTLDAIEIVDQTNLDFVLHEKQMCSCQCQNCDSRDIHPEHNCIFDCQRDSAMLKTEFENDERLNVNCDCKCEFCSSGVTIKTHSRQDCIFFCKSYQRVRKNENDKNNNQSYV